MAFIDDSLTREQLQELHVPRGKLEWLLEALALAGLVVMLVMIALYYAGLPARIPTHFNLAGEVDGWGGKGSILLLFGIALVTYVPMTLVPLKPHIANYPVTLTSENAPRQIRLMRVLVGYIKAVVVWMMGYFVIKSILISQARTVAGLGPLFMVLVIGLVIVPIIPYFILAVKWK